MNDRRPSFYARRGGRVADVVTLLHVPYTLWHLSYVVIGASLAPRLDPVVLGGTLLAFALGLGVGAHALDEVLDRPLGTGLSDRALWILGWGGLALGGAVAVAGAVVISPVVLLWGAAGVLLAAGYSLEWWPWVHSSIGFGLAWGAFPVLVGYWAQAETLSVAAVLVAAAAAVLAMAQRALSTPARRVRRGDGASQAVVDGSDWDEAGLVASWERPLRLLVWAHVLLAAGLAAVAVAG